MKKTILVLVFAVLLQGCAGQNVNVVPDSSVSEMPTELALDFLKEQSNKIGIYGWPGYPPCKYGNGVIEGRSGLLPWGGWTINSAIMEPPTHTGRVFISNDNESNGCAAYIGRGNDAALVDEMKKVMTALMALGVRPKPSATQQ